MNHTEAVEMMLKNLDNWRHLPKYQLERRADMFFGLFIRHIMEARYGRMHDLIIPEFPYKNDKERNTTVNFDYVLFSENLDRVFVVELKTEPESAGGINNSYLNKVVEIPFEDIIGDLKSVVAATNQKNKYNCLIKLLEQIGFILKDSGNKWECSPKTGKPTVVYLTPKLKKELNGKFDMILFDEAADILSKSGGAVECHFASYLRRWNDNPAGSICCE